jgi:hypothetical protein
MKVVTSQILNVDHASLVAAVIRQQIDDQDELLRRANELYTDDDDTKFAPPEPDEPHASVWARRQDISFDILNERFTTDSAFFQFRTHFNKFLNEFLVAYSLPFPGGKPVQFRNDDKASNPSHLLCRAYE